jgi:hypothetical protein
MMYSDLLGYGITVFWVGDWQSQWWREALVLSASYGLAGWG